MATYSEKELDWMAWHTSKLQADGYDMSQMNTIITGLRKNVDLQLEADLLAYCPMDSVTNTLGVVKYANQNLILNPTITIKRSSGVFDKNSAPERFEEMLQKTLNKCLFDFYDIYKETVDSITDAVITIKNAPFTLNLTKDDKTYSLDIVTGVVDTELTYAVKLISTDGSTPISGNTTATSIAPVYIKLVASDTSTTVLTAKGGTIEPQDGFTVSFAPARAISEKTAPFMVNLSNGTNIYSLEVNEGTVNTSLFYTVELISTDGVTPINEEVTATSDNPVFIRFSDATILKCVDGKVAPSPTFAVFFSEMNYTINAPFTLNLASASLGKEYHLDVKAGSYGKNVSYNVTLISTDGINPISEFTQATSTNPVYVRLTGSDGSIAVLTAFGGTVGVAGDFVPTFSIARSITERSAPFKLTLNTYELDVTEGTVNTDLTYTVDTIFVGASTIISGETIATQENPVFVRLNDGTTLKATYGKVDVATEYTIAFEDSTVEYAPFDFKLNEVIYQSVEGAVDTTKTYIVNLISTDGITPIDSNTSASILMPIFISLDDGTRLKIVDGTIAFDADGYDFSLDTE